MDVAAIIDQLVASGRLFHRHGWVPATGGNFSARIGENRFLVTASGCHKGELSAGDFLVVDSDGTPEDTTRKASAETLLHTAVYRTFPATGAVLHTHSVPATLLSRRLGEVRLAGFELQKILEGVETHDTQVCVPVFSNDQNISRLSAVVARAFAEERARQGFLISGHGLYAWGRNVAEARHRVEALEFLFDCCWQGMREGDQSQ